MSVYVIVPARGGSKGILGKNLRVLRGEPLVARTVRAARDASRVDRVFVSTDDPAIARVAREAGAEIIERPASLAGDDATSESALLHALDVLTERGEPDPDVVALVQCTSPLTTGEVIDGTIAVLDDDNADCSFSGSRSHAFLWRRTSEGAVGVNHDPSERPRRQEQVPEYADTGAVYAMRTAGFRVARHRFFGRVAIFEVPKAHELEIDSEEDLEIAEALLQVGSSSAPDGSRLPRRVAGLALDFDGVLTDNKVMTFTDGDEAVICDRSDGLGIEMLRRAGLPMVVLSKEAHPVVAARCQKLGLELVQGLEDKLASFASWVDDHDLDVSRVVFVGNDVNDVACLRHAGCGVVVADAYPAAKANADLVLTRAGGRGAVRELAELILANGTGAEPCPTS